MTYIQNVHLLQLYASTVGVSCHEGPFDTFPLPKNPNTLICSPDFDDSIISISYHYFLYYATHLTQLSHI